MRSGLTFLPQSSANTIRSTRTRPRWSSETSVTWALWPRKPELVIPRAFPSGSGEPQSARSAASSSARRLGSHADVEHAVLAHAACRVVWLHRAVREIRQNVRRVDRPGCAGQGPVDVAVVPSNHGVLARLEQPNVLCQQLWGAPALGVRIVPLHRQSTDSALRVGDGLGDDGDALGNRDDGSQAGLGDCRLVIDRGNRGAEPRWMQHDRRQHPREALIDREMGGTENLRHGVDSQPPFAPDQLVVG